MSVNTVRRLLASLTAAILAAAGLAAVPGPAFASATYFVSSSTGSDSNNGTSSSTPWATLAKVNAAALAPGDKVEFLRGDTWAGGLNITASGTSGSAIVFTLYGAGSARPVITGGANGDCIALHGDYLTVDNLKATACGYAGMALYGSQDTVKNSASTGNAAGVHAATGSDGAEISSDTLTGNNILNVNTSTSSSGAFGVLLNGTNALVHNNTITGSDAPSLAFGRDGSAVEIASGSGNSVYDNYADDNDALIELSGTGCSGNTIQYNRASINDSADTQATGIVLPGDCTGTVIQHNSIDLAGGSSQALVCYTGSAACDAGTKVQDNVLVAGLKGLFMSGSGWTLTGNVVNGSSNVALTGTNTSSPANLVSPPSDLHLTANSPAIDRGSTAPFSTDLDGNPVPSGAAPDSGAYEFQQSGAVSAPQVTNGTPDGITPTGATLHGTVNPDGADTTCHFGYGLTSAYGTPTADQDAGSGTAAVNLSATVSGLTAATLYHWHLHCANSAGAGDGGDATFTTSPGSASAPATVTGAADGITSTGATLHGTVNPDGADTTCHFGYGFTSSYGTSTGDVDEGSGTAVLNLSATVSGLTASTLYHYHLHCTNSAGAGEGGDATFTTASGGGHTVSHIVWITMENHGYSDIIGSSSAPYINNTLVPDYGSMTNMIGDGSVHPSLPNYLDMTSGGTQGDGTYDGTPPCCGGPLPVNNIFHQLPAGASQSEMQSMPSNCAYTGSGTTGYQARHNPQVYYDSAHSGADSATSKSADCANHNIPLNVSSPDLSASFTFISPDVCNDMHSNTCAGSSDVIKQGDDFLSTFIPALTGTSQYQAGNTVIFVTWDESSSGTDHIPTFVIDPFGAHDTSSCQGAAYTHGSMLRYAEDNFGLPELGDASGAVSLSGCFGLP